jgi:predicted integral membrane protein DUF2269
LTLYAAFKLLHVVVAVWFIAGLLGRWIALDAAKRSQDVRLAKGFSDLGGRFETLMVIPGSLFVLISGLVTAFLAGLPLLGPIQGGVSWPFVALIVFAVTMALVPTVFLPRGRGFGAALDDAIRRGEVTPRLRAAFSDPVVRVAHGIELAAVLFILALMVVKPI